jgi:hypothetical protein
VKIFFGGSTKRLYDHKEKYLAIRQIILDQGHILTRDWIKKELDGDTLKPHARYYDLVHKAVNEADAAILDYAAWTPSIGVQLEMALERGLPTLLLFDDEDSKKNRSLGDEFINPKHFKKIHREVVNKKNLPIIIGDFLLWSEKNKPVVRFNLEIDREHDDFLKLMAAKNNSSKAEEIRRLIEEKVSSGNE